MARKIVLSMLAVAVVLAMAGFAAAEAPVMASGESGIVNYSGADPEEKYLSGDPWLERGPVETGSIPAMQGRTAEPMCCSGDNGPSVDASGNTLLRQGIDDGP